MSTLEGSETIGRYKILRPLGAGAMGRVYLAEDPRIERLLAIKTVRVEGEGMEVEDRKRRLLREAKAAGRLIHPHVVTLFDAGDEGEELFLAFEYVQGSDLARRLAAGPPLTLGEALRIARQAAEGLDFAHRQGVIHRDIKPSNILLDEAGGVKVGDFGIAKLAGQATELTMTGSVVGSPHYLSPEQIRGEELDGRSDLFSLGVVLYELLTRRRPFEAETLTTLLYQILHTEPPGLPPGATGHGGRLDALVRRLMAKDPAERFATAGEVAVEIAALEASLPPGALAAPAVQAGGGESEAPTHRTPSPPPPLPTTAAEGSAAPSGGRRGLWLGLTGAAVALLVAVGVAVFYLAPVVLERLGGTGTPPQEEEGADPAAAGEDGPLAAGEGAAGEGEERIASGPAAPDLSRRTAGAGTGGGSLPAEAPPAAAEGASRVAEGRTPSSEPRVPPRQEPTSRETASRDAAPPATEPRGAGAGPGPSRTSSPAAAASTPGEAADTAAREPAPSPSGAAPSRPGPAPSPARGEDAGRRAPEPVPAFDRRLDTGMTVRFQADPADAFVLVDGTVVGRASELNAAGGYTLPSPGEHLVVVRKAGRRDARLLVSASAGGGASVVPVRLDYPTAEDLDLADLPRYRVQEAVAFKVEPKTAQVLVDGVPRGQAADFAGLGRGWLRLERGLYRISLTAPGHRRVDVALEVSSGAAEERQKIEMTLPREGAP